MEDDSKLSYFFLGLGLGVAVGILFAPKAGDETRRLIRHKADEGADYVKRRGSELKDSAADLLDKSKEALKKQKETLASAVEAGKQAYRDAVRPAASEQDLGI